MKKILISFGSSGYSGTLNKLKESANGFFDEVILYDEEKISDFIQTHQEHFKYTRGFGYWVWKPYIILKTLEKCDEGDIVFYSDSTVLFTDSPTELFDILKIEDICLFSTTYKNRTYTKYDTFTLMGLTDDKYIDGEHANAAFILIKKSDKSVSFIREFLSNCENINMISDENKSGVSIEGFSQHRHDQSILSLMAIKYGIKLHRDPSQWGASQTNLFSNSNYKTIIKHHRNKF